MTNNCSKFDQLKIKLSEFEIEYPQNSKVSKDQLEKFIIQNLKLSQFCDEIITDFQAALGD